MSSKQLALQLFLDHSTQGIYRLSLKFACRIVTNQNPCDFIHIPICPIPGIAQITPNEQFNQTTREIPYRLEYISKQTLENRLIHNSKVDVCAVHLL